MKEREREREGEGERKHPVTKQEVHVDPSDLLSLDNRDDSWQLRDSSFEGSAQEPPQRLSSDPTCVVSHSTMCSGGKYCVFLFLLQSSLSDPATTNQGECLAPQRQPGGATFIFF